MRILLFGGFLGSGKTSTILQIARQITEKRHETVAIIENEIGEKGVDDKLLTDSGLKVRPLFGGCVCCQITSDMVTAVRELYDTVNPDWLIIEMTGLAVPGKVADTIRQYDDGRSTFKTITLVDAGRWAELSEVIGPLVTAQVEKSDLVIVNKVDLATAAELEATLQAIKELVGQTPIVTSSAIRELSLTVLEEVFDLE